MTHEYGHYALCDFVHKLGESVSGDVLLTADSLAGGAGDPDPDEEARVVNEAFADFFALQIASGVNYDGWIVERDPNESGVLESVDGGFSFSIDDPGGELNISGFGANADNDRAIGRLAGLAHDLFDGRPHKDAGPTSAAAWIRLPGNQVTHRENAGCVTSGEPSCRVGDTDLESINLSGFRIFEMVQRFFFARNLLDQYRVDAMEKGLLDTALEHANWCQACMVAAPHFRDKEY